jgi:hypothetical protein
MTKLQNHTAQIQCQIEAMSIGEQRLIAHGGHGADVRREFGGYRVLTQWAPPLLAARQAASDVVSRGRVVDAAAWQATRADLDREILAQRQ